MLPKPVTVENLPFRVGRADDGQFGRNDLVIADSSPYTISRFHFAIDHSSMGWVVQDRGSYLGTVVNGSAIGGKRSEGSVVLEPGVNKIVAGKRGSPYRFELVIPE